MNLNRREFLSVAPAAAALAAFPRPMRPVPENEEDPLGVRKWFPVTDQEDIFNQRVTTAINLEF